MKFRSSVAFILLIASIGCSPEASKNYAMPEKQQKVITQDPNVQYFDPSVDILFVVDSSGSMGTHQSNLANNISLFTSTFTKNSILNYNIGVITTDGCSSSYYGCTSDWGQLVGTTKVVSKSTPNGDSILATNLKVGTSGSAFEESFAPVVQALSPAYLAGVNLGFYRPSASLAVIFITDAEDQSENIDPAGLYNFLVNLKNQDASKVLSYGVIVPSAVDNCDRDEYMTKPVRIESFLGMVVNGKKQDNIYNLCDPDFGKRLAGMAKDIVEEVGGVFYLKTVPDVATIQVTYGNLTLPNDPKLGWVFDPSRNAIVLGDGIDWSSQPSGTRVMVNYEPIKPENIEH